MASKHELIVLQVMTDFSVQRRGRLYKMMQGTFRALHSDEIIRISPYPKKQAGYPDLTGFEYDMRYIKPIPIYCLVEVKTLKYSKLTQEQKDHLNYCVSIGGKAYVAREVESGYELVEWRVE